MSDAETGRPRSLRPSLFLLFLLGGLLVFLPTMAFASLLSRNAAMAIRLGTSVFLLGAAILVRRSERYKRFGELLLSLFVASLALFIAWNFSNVPLRVLGLTLESPAGIAVAKFSEAFMIVVAILGLTKGSGSSMRAVFVHRGKLRLGLITGVISFLILSALATLQAYEQGTLGSVLPVTHWTLLFVLANGFMEELLFRGLFLKRLEPFLDRHLSNLAAAIVFTAAHMQVTYAPELAVFVVITFLLALAWGLVMQKTDSLLGSALFHAGADTLIITGILASYGATP